MVGIKDIESEEAEEPELRRREAGKQDGYLSKRKKS